VKGYQLLGGHPLEEGMGREVLHHPQVKILHVGVGVDEAAHPQDIGVLGQQRGRDDPPPEVGLLEVRVGEEEEDLVQLRRLVVSDTAHTAHATHSQGQGPPTCPFSNQFGKCFMALTRAQAMFLYWPAPIDERWKVSESRTIDRRA